jgi:hypothetical protein
MQYFQTLSLSALSYLTTLNDYLYAQTGISAQMAAEQNRLSVKHERDMISPAEYRQRGIKWCRAEKAKELRPMQSALLQMKAKKTTPVRLPSLPHQGETLLRQRTCAHAVFLLQIREKKNGPRVAPIDDALLEQMKKPTAS